VRKKIKKIKAVPKDFFGTAFYLKYRSYEYINIGSDFDL